MHIKNGNTYLLNLTFSTKIKTNFTLEANILLVLMLSTRYYFKDEFVVFSPESFVKDK